MASASDIRPDSSRRNPSIFSLSNALTVAGVAGGPLLLGILFEVSGYALAYFLAAGVSVVSLGAMLAAGAAPELAERTAGAS